MTRADRLALATQQVSSLYRRRHNPAMRTSLRMWLQTLRTLREKPPSRAGGKRPGAGAPVTVAAGVKFTALITDVDYWMLQQLTPNCSQWLRDKIRTEFAQKTHVSTY